MGNRPTTNDEYTLQRVTRDFMRGANRVCGETPGGQLSGLCGEGRLLEIPVAGATPRYARLERAALRLNAVTGEVAPPQWSQPGSVQKI